MKTNILIIFSIFFSFIQCENDESNLDPIVGQWNLVKYYKNDIVIPINECRKKSYIKAYENYKYDKYDYFLNQNSDCDFNFEVEGWWYNKEENYYKVDLPGIIFQDQRIDIVNDTLIYSYNAWTTFSPTIITTPIKLMYTKPR